MQIVVDSGSTKTDWRILAGGEIKQARTEGMNPYFRTDDELQETIAQVELNEPVEVVFFYGAGCGSAENQERIRNVFLRLWPEATVAVASDMLGAARATCGREPGLVAILGTGANYCFYNGHEIEHNRRGWGYVLGDEGSGAHIGLALLKAVLNRELPEPIIATFFRRFEMSDDAILNAVYKGPNPNRFVAQFSRFAFQNRKSSEVETLVLGCFREMFERQLTRLPEAENLPVHLVGSVGFYYMDLLRRMAPEYNMRIGTVLEQPIAALANYHWE